MVVTAIRIRCIAVRCRYFSKRCQNTRVINEINFALIRALSSCDALFRVIEVRAPADWWDLRGRDCIFVLSVVTRKQFSDVFNELLPSTLNKGKVRLEKAISLPGLSSREVSLPGNVMDKSNPCDVYVSENSSQITFHILMLPSCSCSGYLIGKIAVLLQFLP